MSKMKVCKVCQKEVATSAAVCPNCGAKLKMGLLKKLGIGVGALIILFIIIGISSSKDSNTQTASTKQTETSTSKSNDKPAWNTTETDIQKNGNVSIAVNLIKSNGDLKSAATSPSPAAVAKSPWNYYGKVVKITGDISDIQDYPAGSDWSKNLGGKEAGQIVISSDDGTITDMFVVGSTGDLKNGDKVTLYGYPVGLSDVENKVGGKNTQLFIVGNAFEKQ